MKVQDRTREWSNSLQVGGVASGGRGLWELALSAVVDQAESGVSQFSSSASPGSASEGPGSGFRSGSGSSSDTLFSTGLIRPDSGGRAAGSDPEGAGERVRDQVG